MKLISITKVPIGGYFFLTDAGKIRIMKRVDGQPTPTYPVSAVEVDLSLDPECRGTKPELFSGDWMVLV